MIVVKVDWKWLSVYKSHFCVVSNFFSFRNLYDIVTWTFLVPIKSFFLLSGPMIPHGPYDGIFILLITDVIFFSSPLFVSYAGGPRLLLISLEELIMR